MKSLFPLVILLYLSTVLFIPAGLAVATANGEEIYHEGDLIIDGDQTYVIEDVRFVIDGNIIVKDHARFIVKNAEVIVNCTYKTEYWVNVNDKATFEVENSVLDIPEYFEGTVMGMEVGGNALLDMRETRCNWRVSVCSTAVIHSSSIPFLYWNLCGQINISESTIECINLRAEGEGDIEFRDIKPGYIEELHLIKSSAFGQGYLNVTDSSVEQWHMNVFRDFKGNLLIEDSHLKFLWMDFPSICDIKISNIGPGYFSNWDKNNNVLGSGLDFGLTLRNTQVDSWKLENYGKIEAENINALVAVNEGASTSINNGNIQVHSYGGESLIISNSVVRNVFRLLPSGHPLELPGEVSIVEFQNTKISASDIEIAEYDFLIKGDVTISTPIEGVHFHSGTITREYEIQVENTAGYPIPNASVELYDKDSILVYTGITSDNGKEVVTIRFSSSNYQGKWNLTVSQNDLTETKEIGFLTNTPIIIPLHTDKTENEPKSLESVTNTPTSTPEKTQTPTSELTPSPLPEATQAPTHEPTMAPKSTTAQTVWVLIGIIAGIVMMGLITFVFFKSKRA